MKLEEIKLRMSSKKLYFCDDPSIAKEQIQQLDKLFEYNNTRPSNQEKKQQLLKEMFAKIGDNCYIETPFHANWGGKFVHLGNSVYANFNLTLVDDCPIYIGDNVLLAPNVTLCTGTHPIHPELRSQQAQFNLPITIGRNVWIGAGSIVLPGVTIGENTVIGAGSVVTKDIPSNVVAVGNPCKVLRPIDEKDLEYYYKNMKIDITCR
ncbi:sugar O-acetyltransferase [Candidatus Cetobacterium colombiensis]|uniref:Acetyltransferase n=1 Tax=Candidatus Cetobacterium colombiensis TaxID=3073100 RepID=A0ABU4WE04_9FUSO|nr:sugar O-acetyltransferase [Candidatus Cetobacterium colombiensis]MDX8336801.1 sugar O-acetyltransferase [Candidatus Cetobacterium colombiensis]